MVQWHSHSDVSTEEENCRGKKDVRDGLDCKPKVVTENWVLHGLNDDEGGANDKECKKQIEYCLWLVKALSARLVTRNIYPSGIHLHMHTVSSAIRLVKTRFLNCVGAYHHEKQTICL